jgi:uncharacterized phiE125 gp8 family phage protein
MLITKQSQIVTAPVVSVAELKKHVGIDFNETYYNDMLESMEAAAVEYIESRSRLTLRQSTWLVTVEEFPKDREPLALPIWPILDASTVVVQYTPPVGSLTTLTGTQVAIASPPASVYPDPVEYWPETLENKIDAVRITFTAGWTIATIPAMVKHAVKLLVAHWFRNRETVIVGSISKEMEHAVDRLLVQFRRNFFTPFGVFQ